MTSKKAFDVFNTPGLANVYIETNFTPTILALPVSDWKRIILLYLFPGGKILWADTKESMSDYFGTKKDENTPRAFDSLIYDNLIRSTVFGSTLVYRVNSNKIDRVKEVIFGPTEIIHSYIVQPFDKNFTNMTYQFESETNRNVPNKGKYYHFTKKDDESFWISIVKTKGSLKSTKLVLGSLTNPKHRLYKIRWAIIKRTRKLGVDIFIKKNIEDDEPTACGNTRQYSRAALDILKELKMIEEIKSNCKSPSYAITDKIIIEGKEQPLEKGTRQLTWDDVFKRLLDQTSQKLI